jgi:hypothetical protein
MKTISYEVSECCGKDIAVVDGVTVCTYCERQCHTAERSEENFDEVSADDERGGAQ